MTNWRIVFALLALAATASSQVRTTGVRVTEGVMYSRADQKALPDIADLKDRELNAEVAVYVVVSNTGSVTGARAIKGDSGLFKRCEEAARKWHYKPYTINAFPVRVETTITFKFTKNNVQIAVPPSR